jgi:hypothetical protein
MTQTIRVSGGGIRTVAEDAVPAAGLRERVQLAHFLRAAGRQAAQGLLAARRQGLQAPQHRRRRQRLLLLLPPPPRVVGGGAKPLQLEELDRLPALLQ